MYIQGRILKPGDDLTEVINIRNKVFVEEYKIPYNEEFDYRDSIAIHAVAYERFDNTVNKELNNAEKAAVATGRIIYDGDECIIDKVAVLKEYRGKSYGDFIIRLLLNKAFSAGIEKVYAKSFDDTLGFYEKLGFIKTDNSLICQESKKYNMVIDIKSLTRPCSVKNDKNMAKF